MTAVALLQNQLGSILPKAIADTVAACPPDPRRYLGLKLLHELKQIEVEAQRKTEREQAEREKEQWAKARNSQQQSAVGVIQREWKQHVRSQRDQRQRETELLLRVTEREQELDEEDDFREENLQVEEFEGQTEREREVELEHAKAAQAYKKQLALLQKLDKAAVGDVKKLPKVAPQVHTVFKCCFYLLDNKSPTQVVAWQQVRMLIKPALFLDALQKLDPEAPSKKRKFIRVRRILKGIVDEEVKKVSVVAYLLYQWLAAAVELKERKDEDIALKRAEGRDVDEEEEEEDEENENDPKDPEEEVERLKEEEEAARRREEEAEEAGEDGDAAEEDEEA